MATFKKGDKVRVILVGSQWVEQSAVSFTDYYHYSKYIEAAKWYDNIPATGILCWVSDESGEHPKNERCQIVVSYSEGTDSPFRTRNCEWKYATPVTQEEVNKFILPTEPSYKVGDYFTVVEHKTLNDRSWRGDCLEVKVVDGQFIRATNHSGYVGYGLITIDIKQWVLKPLSQEYAQSCISK